MTLAYCTAVMRLRRQRLELAYAPRRERSRLAFEALAEVPRTRRDTVPCPPPETCR